MTRTATFTVTDLACRRGELRVLDGVSFSLAAGEALVLRGPNGSGKTTLLRVLAGLDSPAAGRISAAEGVESAYAGHADGIKAQLTVRENLRFWAAVFGADEAAVERALDVFSLRPLERRRAQNLSAGQKRRLGLARMLVTGRALWLMDEPTVSLDAESTRVFAGMVGEHLAAGGMAILATHIDLGLRDARVLDITAFRARADAAGGAADNPFLAGEFT